MKMKSYDGREIRRLGSTLRNWSVG
jgi:hypothetical protein